MVLGFSEHPFNSRTNSHVQLALQQALEPPLLRWSRWEYEEVTNTNMGFPACTERTNTQLCSLKVVLLGEPFQVPL